MQGVVFIFGDALYGAVDQVPGVCRIVTRFRCVNGFPYRALDSWLVVSRSVEATVPLADAHGNVRGVRIPLNRRSIGMTCIRGVLLPPAATFSGLFVLFLAVVLTQSAEGPVDPGIWWLVAGLFAVAAFFAFPFWLSYRLTRATPERASELRAQLGIRPTQLRIYTGS